MLQKETWELFQEEVDKEENLSNVAEMIVADQAGNKVFDQRECE